MSNATKVTQKDMFNEIIALAEANGRTDLAEFCRDRIEKLSKKNGKVSEKRATEVAENEALVLEALTAIGKAVTVTDLVKSATNAVADMSGQKVSAYLKKLVEAGKVSKTVEKKVSYFSVAVADAE